MKITTKGQVTIPAEIRQRLGQRVIAHLRGRGTVRMTTDEILALTRKG